MSDFDHPLFNRLLADLALQPLDRPERQMIRSLLSGDIETRDQYNGATVDRLFDLGLARGDFDIRPTHFLRSISERGLTEQILGREFL
jgi:hypothetical protein